MTDVTCVPSAGSCWIHLTGTSDAIRWSLEGFNFGPFLEIIGSQPRCSMYGIFTYIYPKNDPNVGKYSIHGAPVQAMEISPIMLTCYE